MFFQSFDAPAKLNLTLTMLNCRPDGYHNIQTIFQFIDLADSMDIAIQPQGDIKLITPVANIPFDHNLVIRAANLLKQATGTKKGAFIRLIKRIPIGSGLGGGSSDAATTLIALNHLWQTHLSRNALMKLAVRLGADIPVFIFGKNAIGGGIGEQLTACTLPKKWYALLCPPVSIATKTVFQQWKLTRRVAPAIIPNPLMSNLWMNDLESVVRNQYKLVDQAMLALSAYGTARMTGSGSCVFLACTYKAAAQRVMAACQGNWKNYLARGLAQHPLVDWVNE